MRILFLTSRHPYPPIGGDKLRVYNFLRYLSGVGHEIHLLSLTDQPVELTDKFPFGRVVFLSKKNSYLNSFRALFSRKPIQVGFYRSKMFQAALDAMLETSKYDLIFCHLLRTAEYVLDFKGVPKIVDLTDAISLNYARILEGLGKNLSFKTLLYSFEKERVLRYEGKIVDAFDRSILISSYDKNYLGQSFDVSKVEVIQNGVDLDYFSYHNGEYNANKIVFVGNMRTVPNSDAALYFGEEIFPIVKRAIPQAEFIIVGSEPTKKICALERQTDDIRVTGSVADVRPYMTSAAVSVAPMRYGAGVQNKILESMAVGTPVVSSSVGLEGISAIPGKEILVEDERERFAECVVNIMQDRDLRQSLSVGGRALIEEQYSWNNALQKLDGLLTTVVSARIS